MQSYIATYCVQLVFLYLPPPFQCLRVVCIDKRSVSAWMYVCVRVLVWLFLEICFVVVTWSAHTHTHVCAIYICVCVFCFGALECHGKCLTACRNFSLQVSHLAACQLSFTFQLYSQCSNFHSTRHGGFANSILFWVMQNEFKTLKNSSFITLESKPLI